MADNSTFDAMSAEEQMTYLKTQLANSESMTNTERGALAASLRALKNYMKLNELFKLDEVFMNTTLRDFLNLKEDGTEYTLDDMKTKGWVEFVSVAAQYHQTNAGSKLNAKYVNSDGREVVFDCYGNVITDYPDKGTFNYANPASKEHTVYDVMPYNKLMCWHHIAPVMR